MTALWGSFGLPQAIPGLAPTPARAPAPAPPPASQAIAHALGGPRRVGGLLGVAGRLSGTVSPFRAEQGTSLETPR